MIDHVKRRMLHRRIGGDLHGDLSRVWPWNVSKLAVAQHKSCRKADEKAPIAPSHRLDKR
jgi:hypothetical protein